LKTRVFALLLSLLPLAAVSADTLEVSLTGGKSITTWHGQADLQAVKFALVRPISPHSDVEFMIAPVSLWQPRSWFGNEFHDGNETVRGLAAAILYRRSFNVDSSRMHFYGDIGTGPLYAEKGIPASTSRFNFVTQAAAGVVLLPNAKTPLLVGYRFLHISNGGYSPRNPGINVSSVEVGLRFRIATKPRG
jgi:lipid A 3-O-deacylase